MVDGKMNVIKYLVFFFNFLFWLSGLALIIVGAIIRDKYGDYFSYADNKFANASVFIIIVGVVVFVVGFLGCCGAIKENYFMMVAFSVLLSIIFILEIVAGALGFAYKKKVEKVAKDALEKAVDQYLDSDEPGAKKLLDWTQKKFHCCGAESPNDYKSVKANSTGNSTTPSFECNGKTPSSCHPDGNCTAAAYTKGCKDEFAKFVKDHMVTIGAVALGVAFIQILGIIFACCLMKSIKTEYEVV